MNSVTLHEVQLWTACPDLLEDETRKDLKSLEEMTSKEIVTDVLGKIANMGNESE